MIAVKEKALTQAEILAKSEAKIKENLNKRLTEKDNEF
jgi:hypothetical protein